MNKNILTQERKLGKIRDHSKRVMAQMTFRGSWVAKESLDADFCKKILQNPPEKFEGILGEMFHFHMLRCLKFFLENEEFALMSKRLTPKGGSADEVVSFRKALLIPLRQSVGSCFATAFLIHLQGKDLLTLSSDLYYAMTRKYIKRVVEEKEIKIPFCPKTGVIKEGENFIASPLMKSYEYTVAGLADAKGNFSKWNFHEALGLESKAEGGLGRVIYSIIEKMLDHSNDKIDELRDEIGRIDRGLDVDESMYKAASTYDQMDRAKRSAKANQMRVGYLIHDYEDEQKYGESLSKLYSFFVEQYLSLFPFYFQELYDPEMFSTGDIVEDRPAGFRLVYKHGRSDAKVWTYIKTDKEYIACLSDFIKITEPILVGAKRGEGIEKQMEEIITQILFAIDEKSFLEEQKVRIKTMHKKYLKEEGNSSAYAYIAGGSLETLANAYLELVNPIKKEEISAKSPEDLCHSLLEYLKDTSKINYEEIENNPFMTVPMTNLTHAFNLLPGMKEFRKAHEHRGNTYSYVRDVMFKSGKPIVFADTNWEGKFLAFHKINEEIKLVLFDGFEAYAFSYWDEHFTENATWSLYYYR